MSNLLKILGTAIIVITMVAVYLLFFRKSNNQVLSKIPGNATSVMVVDVRSLSKKLLLDDLGKGLKNSSKILNRLLPDSTATIDWADNGLGLPDKLALFTLEDTTGVKLHILAPLLNAKKFEHFVMLLGSQMKFTVQKNDGIQWAFAKNPGILLAWDDKFACGMFTSHYTDSNLNSLRGILASSEEQSIMADTCFVRQLASTFDVMVYSKNYHKCPSPKLELLNDNMEYCVSLIQFNAGEIKINSVIKPKARSPLNKLFGQTSNSMPVLTNSSQAPVSISLLVNPAVVRQLFNQYKPVDVTAHLSGYPDVWDGRLTMKLNGVKTINNKFTTYEFDDNFNKIAITKLKKDTILDIQLVAGVLNNTERNMHPIVNGNDTLLFAGGNIILKKAGQFCTVYNRNCTKPEFSEAPVRNQIEVSVAYPQLSSILRKMGLSDKAATWDGYGINGITTTVHASETINITGSLTFPDTKRNSFYMLLEKIPMKGF
jgi:hypothetical protein